MSLRFPIPLSKYRGKRYYKFQVRLKQSGVHRDYWERTELIPIIAESPAAACNAIKDEFVSLVTDPTEIECLGPKGGITARFIGYEGLIWGQMCRVQPDYKQLPLFQKA
jgi:hypothetical protein